MENNYMYGDLNGGTVVSPSWSAANRDYIGEARREKALQYAIQSGTVYEENLIDMARKIESYISNG